MALDELKEGNLKLKKPLPKSLEEAMLKLEQATPKIKKPLTNVDKMAAKYPVPLDLSFPPSVRKSPATRMLQNISEAERKEMQEHKKQKLDGNYPSNPVKNSIAVMKREEHAKLAQAQLNYDMKALENAFQMKSKINTNPLVSTLNLSTKKTQEMDNSDWWKSSCVCTRKQEIFACFNCDKISCGRYRKQCPHHLNISLQTDFVSCPHCLGPVSDLMPLDYYIKIKYPEFKKDQPC